MRLFRRWLAVYRANTIKITTRNYYDGLLEHFCRATKAKDDMAFVIRREGIMGGPVIDQIVKPSNVTLSETDNFVVIKDGYVYELKKTRM